MELKDRIKTAMDAAGLSPADLARATKTSPGGVSQWLDGKTKSLKAETAARIEKATSYSARWISTGEGQQKIGTASGAIISTTHTFTPGEASGTPSNQAVSPVDTAQADTNSIAAALAVIQKHTQRLSILDPPSRDLVNGLLADLIKRPELACYLDSGIQRIFSACAQKNAIPDHTRTGTTG